MNCLLTKPEYKSNPLYKAILNFWVFILPKCLALRE